MRIKRGLGILALVGCSWAFALLPACSDDPIAVGMLPDGGGTGCSGPNPSPCAVPGGGGSSGSGGSGACIKGNCPNPRDDGGQGGSTPPPLVGGVTDAAAGSDAAPRPDGDSPTEPTPPPRPDGGTEQPTTPPRPDDGGPQQPTNPPRPDGGSPQQPTNPPRPDALGDASFSFPDVAPPPAGLVSCMQCSPATGGGCLCAESKQGHTYAVGCAGGSTTCTCAVDNVPTKTIPSLADTCVEPSEVAKECGFPL
ncbi:MAG TPA: hypothetical protein VGG33_21850 [Polyangia bacterium]